MPEPDYESEEWKDWEIKLTTERAEEVVAIKMEESPGPEESTPNNQVIKVKIEED